MQIIFIEWSSLVYLSKSITVWLTNWNCIEYEDVMYIVNKSWLKQVIGYYLNYFGVW